MSFTARRLLTTSASRWASATEASAEIFERCGNGKPFSIRKQVLDANQLQLLSITLNRTPSSNNPQPNGTPVPAGYHLVYFTPSIIESELGLDGTDRTVNPLTPYTRRMWAGGELTWKQDPNALLRVGQEVRETTTLLSAEPKQLKSGGEMLVVGVEKTFENSAGIAVVDKRSWVFQKEITPESPLAPPAKPTEKATPSGHYTRDFCQSDVTLFRFSALTFNAHKIHFSPEWCRKVEGHRTCVVHGPLNLINILDFWRDTTKGGSPEAVPMSIAYRAMSPLYMGEPYRILLSKGGAGGQTTGNGEWNAEIWDNYGRQSMKGAIKG
ncbi:hypothetical protein OPT61_g1670 [Boeremia exigua]|uniref:Uncharacterized protein n=1 Tax=Boeremia exigua TaxID=749465 RepID=A0ACC2IPB5_9PLEO|nr:hypothetical protein OPT61_g1670 [Boeremia exigua]